MKDLHRVSLDAAKVLRLLPPYPVVLVTTGSNIITINQVAYFTFAPLRLGIGVAQTRYTHGLLKTERAFVINVPDASLLNAVRLCGSVSGREVDKFAAAGLTRCPALKLPAAGIGECGAQIECQVDREMAFEERTWFIGPVVAAQQREGHTGAAALTCGREAYRLPGDLVTPR